MCVFAAGKPSKAGAAAVAGGDQAQLLVPLDVPSQKTALQHLAGENGGGGGADIRP